jgi:hypothetical protein
MGVRDLFPKHFFGTARKAISIFEKLDADWMFIGAVSVAAWGRVRATTDADFAVSLDFTSAAQLDQAMKDSGIEKESGPVEIPAKRLVLSKYWAAYPGGGLGVDVFYATGYDTGRFLKQALDRKIQVQFQGKRYFSTTPEDLIVFKVHAYRARDLDDVATVMERRYADLDWKYIHRWAKALRFDKLLEEVVRQFMESQGLKGPWPWKRRPAPRR